MSNPNANWYTRMNGKTLIKRFVMALHNHCYLPAEWVAIAFVVFWLAQA